MTSTATRVDNRPESIFGQPNHFGTFAAILLMVALGAALGFRSPLARGAALVTAVVSLVALALSLSRGSWIGALLGGAVLLSLLPKARKLLPVAAALLAVAAILALTATSTREQAQVVRARAGSLSASLSASSDARPAIWREALREMRQSPLTGTGPGSFVVAAARPDTLAPNAAPEHAHNILLTVGAETGLPAVALLIGFAIAMGRVAIRAVRWLPDRRDKALVAGIGCGLFVPVGEGLFDFPLRNANNLLLLASLVGLLLAAYRVSEGVARSQAPAHLAPAPGGIQR